MKTRQRILLLSVLMFNLLFLWLTAGTSAAGKEPGEETLIRVGLSGNTASITVKIEEGTYTLVDGAIGLPIGSAAKGDTLSFAKIGNSIEVMINGDALSSTFRGPIEVVGSNELSLFSYRSTSYRGNFNVRVHNDNLLIINELDIEKYLYGVVGPEMGYTAPLEALKAQAVVSRSFALSSIKPANIYDVGIDIMTQVYRGYSAEILSNQIVRAVDATAGEVIYYQFKEGQNNVPIQAYFHANAGGHTENSENVWLTPLPYIVAVPSPYDIFAKEYLSQDQRGWPGNSYQWQVSYSREEVLDRIAVWNSNAQANNRTNTMILVGKINDIKANSFKRDNPNEATESGRITELEFIGDQGTASVLRESIRTLFSLKSILFDLRLDSDLSVLTGSGTIHSTSKGSALHAIGATGVTNPVNNSEPHYYVMGATTTVEKPKLFQYITFDGKGHGHGLGMSQWGAMGMANNGYNYKEIIQHYYNHDKNEENIQIMQYRR